MFASKDKGFFFFFFFFFGGGAPGSTNIRPKEEQYAIQLRPHITKTCAVNNGCTSIVVGGKPEDIIKNNEYFLLN